MPKKNTLLFDDYNIKKAFNWILAIEPELWTDYFYDHKEWTSRPSSRRTKRKDIYKDLKYHTESDHITEIDNMHKLSEKRRLELIKQFTNDYKWYYTLWSSTQPSGWVHFHIFSNKSWWKITDIFRTCNMDNIHHNLLQVPLFCVIDNMKTYWRYRWSYWFKTWIWMKMPHECRSHVACTKNDFLPWIEFRANNVFDIRLYWYYVWITLLWISNIRLDKTIKNKNDLVSLMTWINQSINHSDKDEDWKLLIDEHWRIKASFYKEHVDMKDAKRFSMPNFKKNIWKILFILTINNLTKAREALEEYLEEIMWLKFEATPFDFTTWKLTKATWWYTIEISWVVAFFVQKNWIRTILSKFDSKLFTTLTNGALSSITSTLKKVNLISK